MKLSVWSLESELKSLLSKWKWIQVMHTIPDDQFNVCPLQLGKNLPVTTR